MEVNILQMGILARGEYSHFKSDVNCFYRNFYLISWINNFVPRMNIYEYTWKA